VLEVEKVTARIRLENEARDARASEKARTMREKVDRAFLNERLAHVLQNTGEDKDSRYGSGMARARQPAPTSKDRSFSPDTTDHIPSCLEEEFPRYATATENFPPKITKENIRQRHNDYQRRLDSCADRLPCGICGGSFQSDSVQIFSQEKLLELENQHELDSCAVHDEGVNLCHTCGHDLEVNGRMSVPKFSGANCVNKSLCQHRPSVFDDLTLVER
jgi:hypothetical protein